MNRERLESLLRHPRFALDERDDAFHASVEQPLKVLALAGTDVLRFDNVDAILLEPELLASGCVGLLHGERFTTLPLDSIFGLERQGENKAKRRTGFL